jgi:hypothetical protein
MLSALKSSDIRYTSVKKWMNTDIPYKIPMRIATSQFGNVYVVSMHPPGTNYELSKMSFRTQGFDDKSDATLIMKYINQHGENLKSHPILGDPQFIGKSSTFSEYIIKSFSENNISALAGADKIKKDISVSVDISKLENDVMYESIATQMIMTDKIKQKQQQYLSQFVKSDGNNTNAISGIKNRNLPFSIDIVGPYISSVAGVSETSVVIQQTIRVSTAVQNVSAAGAAFETGAITAVDLASTAVTAAQTASNASALASTIASNAAAVDGSVTVAANIAGFASAEAAAATAETVAIAEATNIVAANPFSLSTAGQFAKQAAAAAIRACTAAIRGLSAAEAAVKIAGENAAKEAAVVLTEEALFAEAEAVLAAIAPPVVKLILIGINAAAIASIFTASNATAAPVINNNIGNGGSGGVGTAPGAGGGGIGGTSGGTGGSSGGFTGSGGNSGGGAGSFGGNPGAGQGGSGGGGGSGGSSGGGSGGGGGGSDGGGSGSSGGSGGSGGSGNGSNNTNACTTSITYDENGEILEIDICLSSSNSSNPEGDDGIPNWLPGDPLIIPIGNGGGSINPPGGIGGTDPTDNDGTNIGPQVPGSGGGDPSAPTGGGGGGNNPDGNDGTDYGPNITGSGGGAIDGGPRPLEPDDYYHTALNGSIFTFFSSTKSQRAINTSTMRLNENEIMNIVASAFVEMCLVQIQQGSKYNNNMNILANFKRICKYHLQNTITDKYNAYISANNNIIIKPSQSILATIFHTTISGVKGTIYALALFSASQYILQMYNTYKKHK